MLHINAFTGTTRIRPSKSKYPVLRFLQVKEKEVGRLAHEYPQEKKIGSAQTRKTAGGIFCRIKELVHLLKQTDCTRKGA